MPVTPQKTQRLLGKAQAFIQSRNFERADRLCRTLLRHNPDNWHAHMLYGTMLLHREEIGKAKVHLERSLAINPRCSEAKNNLGVVYRKMGRGEQATTCFLEARALDPGAADVRSNIGSSFMDLGRFAEAERELRKSIELAPDHHDGNWNLSLCLLVQKKWQEGLDRYDWGFRSAEREARPYAQFFPQWKGQDLEGKTILIWSEQGIGDDILFATCMPDLIETGAKIVIDAHPRLERLFRLSFPSCAVYGNRKNPDVRWLLKHRIDYQCAFGSLPRWFRRTDEDFARRTAPILKAPNPGKYRPAGLRGTGGKPRIGIAWRGGAIKTGMNRRSLPLAAFAPLLQAVDAEWVSVQYGHVYEEVCKFPEIWHDEAAIEDFVEQANLIASCDVVVSVIQTAVHMAGALAVPCVCLVPYGQPWKFPDGEIMPWHPSVQQVHMEDGQWSMSRVAALTRSLLPSTSRSTEGMRIAS